MPKGFGGGPGMNMQGLMKQAQKMQKQMAEMQEALASKTLEVTAGGGAVTVVVSGEKLIKNLVISPEVVDPDDVEFLQDLITGAVNEAIRQIQEYSDKEMSKVTGAMNMPGIF